MKPNVFNTIKSRRSVGYGMVEIPSQDKDDVIIFVVWHEPLS